MPLMLIIIIPPTIIALLGYKSNVVTLFGLLAYAFYYTYFYIRLVKFKTPKILIFKAKLLTRKYPQN